MPLRRMCTFILTVNFFCHHLNVTVFSWNLISALMFVITVILMNFLVTELAAIYYRLIKMVVRVISSHCKGAIAQVVFEVPLYPHKLISLHKMLISSTPSTWQDFEGYLDL